jgi:hypothetical protein
VPIDDHRWFNTLRAIQGSITSEEAGAIIDVARLAATADGTTSIDELAVIVMLRRMITEMAGGRMPDPSGAIDAHRLEAIGHALTAPGPRELAYACAMIVMMHDLKLTAEERDLAAELAKALVIEPGRAKTITAQVEALVRDEKHAPVVKTGTTVSGSATTLITTPDKLRS